MQDVAFQSGVRPESEEWILAARRTRSRRRNTRRRRKTSAKKIIFCTIMEIVVIVILAVVIGWNKGVEAWIQDFTGSFNAPVVEELDVNGVNSLHVVLMDNKSGKVLGQYEGEEAMYPASLTKMMTAIVAIEEIGSLNKEITLSDSAFAGLYEQGATQAGFQPGETVKAIDLIYGVMLPSGAECCIALAEEIAGSESAFVDLMNKKAKKLGMEKTNFKDCTGLHDPDHYSSAYDMAILLRYALHNSTFREIIESPRHSTPSTNVHRGGITYYSTLFKNLSNPSVTGGRILGGKTGYTSEAGHCLASFAEIEGREYILVTAGASEKKGPTIHIQDAQIIYNRLGEAAQAVKNK